MSAISASLVLAACLLTAISAGAQDTLSVIHKFKGGNDGDMPNSLTQASDGNFYGTCAYRKPHSAVFNQM